MGGFISRRLFPRAKDLSTYRLLLEGLEAEISKLSGRRATKFAQHRQIVRSLVLYCSAAFVCLCGVVYALSGQYSRPVLAAPIVAFPLLIVLSKRAIDAMFDSSLRHDDRILAKLEKQKERMLEELIEQTNFTRTQQLINTFQKRPQQQQQQQITRQAMRPQQQQQAGGSSVTTPRRMQSAAGQANTSSPQQSTVSPAVSTRTSSFTPPQSALPGLLPGQPYVTPADIQRFHRTDVQKPAPRSAVDKVIDFALGDGPNNRYALICQSCFTHNGLVKEDDLASVRYRCVMCNFINGQKLPSDWKPNIHTNTIQSIIQSTPTKPQQPGTPSKQQAKDDTDSSLFFSTSSTASLKLPESNKLSASNSSPSTSESSSVNNALPAHEPSDEIEVKDAGQAVEKRERFQEERVKR